MPKIEIKILPLFHTDEGQNSHLQIQSRELFTYLTVPTVYSHHRTYNLVKIQKTTKRIPKTKRTCLNFAHLLLLVSSLEAKCSLTLFCNDSAFNSSTVFDSSSSTMKEIEHFFRMRFCILFAIWLGFVKNI